MKRLTLGLCLLVIVGCKKDKAVTPEVCGEAKSCSTSGECDLGDVCEQNCCVPFSGCSPDSCAGDEFCDEDFTCKKISAKCTTVDCECHILNTAGQIEAQGDPTLVLASGGTKKLQAVLTIATGGQLPGATFDFSLDSTSSFTLDGDMVTATSTATTSGSEPKVTASASGVSCQASLVNLGDAPTAGGEVRFYAFDDLTGAAVGSAKIVVGDSSTAVLATGDTDNTTGMVTISSLPATANISVFKDGYNYLTVVGLDTASVHDVALPLSARPDPETVGGFTGKMDWSHYEKLRGKRQLKAAIVGSSIPLKALLNFDLDLFVGPLPDVDCSKNPGTAGCYQIDISGLTPAGGTSAPLPGGVVLGLGSTAIKDFFDTVGVPGRRYAWSLGGELDLGDLGGLIAIGAPYFQTCACNATDACDADCTCDTDCTDIPFGGVFNNVVPLLSELASSAKANIPLHESLLSTWQEYITPTYGPDRSTDFTKYPFPVLDSGTTPPAIANSLGEFYYDRLQVSQLLGVFTDYSVPALPADPDYAGTATPYTMEGMIVLTGVNAAGFGFVPLGLGAGLDCTEGDCLDRVGNAAGFDGHVNGGTVCLYDVDEDNKCDDLPGLPNDPTSQGKLPDDHLGVFHAKAHSGLEKQDWLTIVGSLPLSTLGSNTGFRATAYVVHGEPPQGPASLPNSFQSFPAPAVLSGRIYQVDNDGTSSVHWATLATSSTPSGKTVRWNVYLPAGGGKFIAPDPVGDGGVSGPVNADDRVDPFAPETATDKDVPQNNLNVTHLAFKLPATLTLQSLAANNGTTLGDMLEQIEAFSAQNKNVVPQ